MEIFSRQWTSAPVRRKERRQFLESRNGLGQGMLAIKTALPLRNPLRAVFSHSPKRPGCICSTRAENDTSGSDDLLN